MYKDMYEYKSNSEYEYAYPYEFNKQNKSYLKRRTRDKYYTAIDNSDTAYIHPYVPDDNN